MGEKKMALCAVYYPIAEKEDEEREIENLFGNFFQQLLKIESEKELSPEGENNNGNTKVQECDLLVASWHKNVENVDIVNILNNLREKYPGIRILVVYREEEKKYIPEFKENGIEYFLPFPWDDTTIESVLHPIIETLIFSKKLDTCEKELENFSQNNGNMPGNTERMDEIRKTLAIKENFFFLKSREVKRLVNEIANMNALLLQTQLRERQQEYLGRLDQATARLRKITREIEDFSRRRSSGHALKIRPFDINGILDNTGNMLEEKFRFHNTELVFYVDRSVPATIEGDPLLLGQALTNLVELLIDRDGENEIVVKIFMEESIDVNGKKNLHFEITKGSISETGKEKEEFLTLENTQAFHEALEWIETMGGKLYSIRDTGNVPFSFVVPVKQMERRSYRLPSKEWMKKSMLIIEGNETIAKALRHMLEYFHFRVIWTKSIQRAARILYEETFDMIFVDERLFELFMTECISRRREAKLIMITKDDDKKKKNQDYVNVVDAFLPKPFTHQKIFDVVIEIYSKDKLESMQETLNILKENLAFLFGGLRALYIGSAGSDQMTVKGLLESANMAVFQTDSAVHAAPLLPSADLVFISDSLPDEEWDRVLSLCREQCGDKPVVALVGESSSEKIGSIENIGVTRHIFTPVDPENFYRTVLEEILE